MLLNLTQTLVALAVELCVTGCCCSGLLVNKNKKTVHSSDGAAFVLLIKKKKDGAGQRGRSLVLRFCTTFQYLRP